METIIHIELETAPGGPWKRMQRKFTCPVYAAQYAKAFARHHWLFGVRVEGGPNVQTKKFN